MALPPDTGDSFIREVDENLKRDQARDFAKRNLTWLIGGMLLFLAAVAGYLFWQHRERQQASAQTEELAQVFRDIGSAKAANVGGRLDAVAANSNDVTKATALFAKAAVLLEDNNRTAALAEYRKLAADPGLPQEYRDLATLRATSMEFDSLKPEEVIARLKPFTQAGNPWFGSAGELSAMAMLKQGKKTEAGRQFAAIAADQQVPNAIRSRAVQIAGTLGVDASASMPTLISQGQ